MYHAYNHPHIWSEGYYFFTFPNKEACAKFKLAVTEARIARFLREPLWGDEDSNRASYTPEAVMTWGCTIYAFEACTGPRGSMPGDWVENPVAGMSSLYYLRIRVPGLEEHDPFWKRLVAQYK